MTLAGAIKQLHELRSAEDMPFYYKPAIAEVINVLLMDTQEMRHGYWKGKPIAGYSTVRCSECGEVFMENNGKWNYCPNCGAKMENANG